MSSPGNGNFTLDIFSAAQAAADCRWLSSWSSISHSTGEASGEGVLRIKAYPIPGLRGTNAGVYTLEGGIEHVFPQIFAGCLQLVAKIPLRMADPSNRRDGCRSKAAQEVKMLQQIASKSMSSASGSIAPQSAAVLVHYKASKEPLPVHLKHEEYFDNLLVLERVDEDLAHFMKSSHLQLKSPLSGQEAEKVAFKEAAYRRLHLVVDLVRMLSGLHLQTKVVHLDLKKENISIEHKSGRPKALFADFGKSLFLHDPALENITQMTDWIDWPHWKSRPSQSHCYDVPGPMHELSKSWGHSPLPTSLYAHVHARIAAQAIDIWALGMICLELLVLDPHVHKAVETEAQLCSLEACVSIVASKTHKTLADVKDNHWDEVLLAQAEHHRIFEEMIKEIWVFWRGYLKSLSHYERDALTGVFGVLDHLHGFFDLDQACRLSSLRRVASQLGFVSARDLASFQREEAHLLEREHRLARATVS